MAKKKVTGDDGKEYIVKEKKPFYKRWWFVVLTVIIIIGFFASGEDESEVSQSVTDDTEIIEDEENAEEVIENKEFGISEPVEFGGQIVKITEVEYSNGDDFDRPAEGKEYVIVHVRIENNSDEEISYNPFNFTMENSNGQIEDQTFTIIDSDTSLSSGELRSDGNVEGTVVFEQPVDDGGLKLIFKPGFWSTDEVIFNLQ